MKWVSEVEELHGDLDLLKAIVAELGFRFVDDAFPEAKAKWHLTSDNIDSMASALEAKQCLNRLADAIQRIPEGVLGGKNSIRLGALLEDQAGNWGRHIYGSANISIAPVTLRATVKLTLSETGFTEEQLQQQIRDREIKERQERISNATSHARALMREPEVVSKVLDLMSRPATSHSLFNVYELIESQMRGRLEALTSTNELRRFKRSMQHPAVLGIDSRHAVSKEDPPSNPMRLNEAKSYMEDLVKAWIETIGKA